MDLLSYTYILIDLACISIFILGFFYQKYLIIIGIVGYFIYPIFYEALLKLFFVIVEKCKTRQGHTSYHLSFGGYNQIVYDDVYNIRVMGIEKQSPFDAHKSGKIYSFLCQNLTQQQLGGKFNQPGNIDYSFIYTHVSLRHLILLNYSLYLSKIAEVPVFYLPGSLLRILTLRRFLYATQGTLKACCLALEKGTAFNLGGGYHHAHSKGGSGFCFYNDIGLAIQHLRKYHSQQIQNILILDLDAHQGNGHERDKIYTKDENIYIIDFYNNNIFPQDTFAKQAINDVQYLNSYTRDDQFLKNLQQKLENLQEQQHSIDFVIYNAGTDILMGDRLGQLNITREGIIERDQVVFNFCKKNNIPVVMLLSGGYQKNNAKIISESICKYLKNQQQIIYFIDHINQKIYTLINENLEETNLKIIV